MRTLHCTVKTVTLLIDSTMHWLRVQHQMHLIDQQVHSGFWCCGFLLEERHSTSRASPAVLSLWTWKIFHIPGYFFSTPPIKLKLGLLQIGGRLLIATRLDQSKLSSQSTAGVLGFAIPFYQPEQIGNKNVGPKPFRSPKLAWFDFSLSNFAVQGHTLSSAGDALSHWPSEIEIRKLQQ
jgi:hypothetical protein